MPGGDRAGWGVSAPTLTWSPRIFEEAARAADARTYDGAWRLHDGEVMRGAIHAAVWALGDAEPAQVKDLTSAILWPRGPWTLPGLPARDRAKLVRLCGPEVETPPPNSRGWLGELQLLFAHQRIIVSGGRYSTTKEPLDEATKARALVAAAWLRRGER